MSAHPGSHPHLVVVGAGLAGLVAAADAAARGAEVTIFDGAGHVGGRAHTTVDDDYRRNLGVHAVYRRGELAQSLSRLGVGIPGRPPNLLRAQRLRRGELVGKAGLARLSLVLPRLLSRRPAAGTTVAEWLDDAPLDEDDRSLVLMLIRTATYVHAPDVQDAVAARQQVRLAVGGVTYVHGGWVTLVDGLVGRIERCGGRVHRSTPVQRVLHDDAQAHGIELADGRQLPADGVILAAGGPRDASRLLVGEPASRLESNDDVPVRIAGLDVTLDRLPRPWPAQVFGDGDDPRYWLAQSRFALLAPGDGAVVHVARYLAPGERAGGATRTELEELFDLVQPGWRRWVRDVRFLPNLTVTHALPRAAAGGLDGRVPVTTTIHGLALAGDAIGPVGQLADAAAASAVAATATVLEALGVDSLSGARS